MCNKLIYSNIYKPAATAYCVYHIWENICGGNFHGFCGFSLDHNFFLQIMALLISITGLQNYYSESFTVNSYFPLKMQKFFPRDAFPYTVISNV